MRPINCFRKTSWRKHIDNPYEINVMEELKERRRENEKVGRQIAPVQFNYQIANFISGFPGVLGCIGSTYIPFRAPANKNKSSYVNHQQQISITLQGICDANGVFLDVFTGPPSRIQDASVYRLSFVYQRLPELCSGDVHLIGDETYPLFDHMLVFSPVYSFWDMSEKSCSLNDTLPGAKRSNKHKQCCHAKKPGIPWNQHGRARLDEAYGKAAPSLLANRTYEANLTLEQKISEMYKIFTVLLSQSFKFAFSNLLWHCKKINTLIKQVSESH
ncbi:hypothetical protein OUZ56_023716 [Daphnia magna]|uniref:DDE Tnp4 domain-containing protein n=1 Tax=Daphnia magna TaxID=35525 RepID=A0ABR0AZH7_9CRUS|nr:hypothetical protein OUZ56_023716 [Daphnia magna]